MKKHKLKTLLLEQKGEVLWIFLNRPTLKNAFSIELAKELLQSIREGMKSKNTAVIVLSAKGDSFSAGGDIKMMGALGLYFGWIGVLATLMLGSFGGLAYAISLMIRGRYEKNSYIPFGPFLAVGAFAFWLFHGPLLRVFAF